MSAGAQYDTHSLFFFVRVKTFSPKVTVQTSWKHCRDRNQTVRYGAGKSVTDEMDNYHLQQTYTQIRNGIHGSFNKGRNVWLSLTPLIIPLYIKPQAAIYRRASQTNRQHRNGRQSQKTSVWLRGEKWIYSGHVVLCLLADKQPFANTLAVTISPIMFLLFFISRASHWF